MAQAYITERANVRPTFSPVGSLTGAALFVLLALLAFFAVHQMNPPDAVSAQAPLTEFSSGRAMNHLRPISQSPHPIGSSDHARVRDYIFAQLSSMGLDPSMQETTSVQQLANNFVRGASVQNIVVRLKGTETSGSKALMLVGHYDSRQNAYGASDDGAAVAAMLETVRALKADAPLKNDVIFLFSDGEESGLLGANAFVAEHPWAKDVGLVLNFEARGTGGPAVMFETSKGNRWLIDGLAQAATHPIANSLMYDIYRLLPNDTDLTVFKGSGLAGMNFAFINEPTHYHTRLDNLENLDERSLQHQGSYALALAKYFGNQNLNSTRSGNAVYFDLFGFKLVHYPASWVLPLTILAALAFVAVVWLGLRRRQVTLGGIVLSFLAFLISMVVAPVIVSLVWWLIRTLNGGYKAMGQGDVYHSGFYFLSFTALTVAIVSTLCILFRKRLGTQNLALGALLWGLLLLLASSLFLPGGSYLLAWPLLAGLITMALIFTTAEREGNSPKRFLVLVLGAVPAIVLLVPMIYLLFVSLTVSLAGAVAVLLVLLLGFMIPQLSFLTSRQSWLLPGAMLVASLFCIGLGLSYSGFDKSQPKPDNLFYGLDADKQEAVWASMDRKPDEYTTQFLTGAPQSGTLEEFFPGTPRPFLKKEAPVAQLPAPELKVLDDSTVNDVRTLRLRLTSPRQAPLMALYTEPDTLINKISINGKQERDGHAPAQTPAQTKEPWVMRYYALPAEGIELVLETKSARPLKLRLVDQSYELPVLPNVAAKARPENIMPSSSNMSDTTFVSKSYTF